MAYLQLQLTVLSTQQSCAEQALEDLGAMSISLVDAMAGKSEERAILEPAVGETPVWQLLHIQGLFPAASDRRGLLAALAELMPDLTPAQVELAEIEDRDWARVWMDQYKPMRFGRNLWVYPSNIEPVDRVVEDVVIRLDPGLAFGSGTHPTTALCLEWLAAQHLQERHVLDFGCGSGVLAIAALKLGAASATGIDNDPQALSSSRDNAERNDVASRLCLVSPELMDARTYDVIVANILTGPLLNLAPRLVSTLAPGAPIALSGILRDQADEVVERYAAVRIGDISVDLREDWVRVSGRKT